MMRTLLVGTLCALAALLGSWLAAPQGEMASPLPATEIVAIPTIATPVFRDGAVVGYFLVRVTLEIEERAAESRVPARTVLTDAILAYVFANPDLPYGEGLAFDLDRFRTELEASVTPRIGGVRQLLVSQIDFLSKDDIRDNAIGRRAPGAAS